MLDHWLLGCQQRPESASTLPLLMVLISWFRGSWLLSTLKWMGFKQEKDPVSIKTAAVRANLWFVWSIKSLKMVKNQSINPSINQSMPSLQLTELGEIRAPYCKLVGHRGCAVRLRCHMRILWSELDEITQHVFQLCGCAEQAHSFIVYVICMCCPDSCNGAQGSF